MKSFLLYAVFVASFLAGAKAGCDENVINTMNECVRIRTDARDSFCVTKPAESSKCNCVYGTIIHACYDYCPDEPTIQTAKQQLEASINSYCAAANLDPDNIPANVYNEITESKTDNFNTAGPNANTNNNSNNNYNNGNMNTNGNMNGNTASYTNQNQGTNTNNSQNTLSNEDYSGAETTKLCSALLIANVILAALLL